MFLNPEILPTIKILEKIMTKYVYSFGSKKTDGKAEMKNLLGGKGANLAEMSRLNISVPEDSLSPRIAAMIFLQTIPTFPLDSNRNWKKR